VARDTLEWPKTKMTVRGDVDYAKSQRLQQFSCVERVTGIEPALSAWELFELMGMCLVPCEFRGHGRPGVSLGCLP
jgi:hypothetical protein